MADEINEFSDLEDGVDEEILDEALEGIGRSGRFSTRRFRNIIRRRRKLEGVSWPLYDSEEIATSGTTTLTMFQVPVGQASKTQLDTNMKAAGLIQTGERFQMHSIGFGLQNSAAASIGLVDFREILETGYLQISIQDREYFNARLTMLPFGGGYTAVSDGATTTTQDPQNGAPDHRVMYKFLRKIVVPRNVHFQISLNWPVAPTPTVAIRAVVWINGILWRAKV